MTVGVRAKRSRQAEKKIKLKEIFRRAKLIKPIVFVSLESKAQQMKWSYSHRDSFVWTSLDCVEKKLSVCARRSTRLLDHSSLDSSFLSARSDSMNLTCVLSYSDVRFNKETKTDLYRTIFFYVEQTTNEQQISMCRLEKERTETDRRSLMFFFFVSRFSLLIGSLFSSSSRWKFSFDLRWKRFSSFSHSSKQSNCFLLSGTNFGHLISVETKRFFFSLIHFTLPFDSSGTLQQFFEEKNSRELEEKQILFFFSLIIWWILLNSLRSFHDAWKMFENNFFIFNRSRADRMIFLDRFESRWMICAFVSLTSFSIFFNRLDF